MGRQGATSPDLARSGATSPDLRALRLISAGLPPPKGDGVVDRAEFARALEKLGFAPPPGPAWHRAARAHEAALDALFAGFDPNGRGGWLKVASASFDDSAPFASLDYLKARAAPTHRKAQPRHLESSSWLQ